MELLAPNGKPSKLNQEQWLLVRTPEFKAWFGDWEKLALTKLYDSGIDEISLKRLQDSVSKVVDENGEPLVVYHGSKSENDFYVFNDSNFIYFANKKSYVQKHFVKNFIEKPFRLKEYFLNIRNLLNVEHLDFYAKPYEQIQHLLLPIFDIDNDVEEITKYKNEYIRFWEVLRFSKKLFPKIKQKKVYDGISFYENWSDYTTWENIDDWSLSFVVMNPNQIKLADGTNTTFDSNNPDIRFEDGGEITNYTEFFDNLEIEDGSIYIGQKFGDVFPFLKRRGARPNTYRNMVNQYYGILDRLRKDNFSSPIQKKRDLNKLDRIRNIEKKKYLAKFYLDGIGTIVDFRASNYDDKNDDIRFENGGLTEIEQWKLEQAQNDQQSFEILQDYFGFELPENADTYEYKNGGKVSKTPAPKSEQIYGSKVNKQDSSSDIKKAKNIKFDEKTLLSINEKVKEHNKEYPNKKINLASAKAVVRRGMGAYSSSHRPTITGGKPNSRVAWGLARLNAFIYKIINGKSKSGRYTQDDDLIKELNIMVKSYKDGGEIPKANKMFHLPIELTVYVPSTQDVDKVVSKKEMNDRVNEVKNYLGRTFGGFSASDVQGGFVASDGNIVNEDIIKVVSFAQKEDYEKNKEELVKKITEWAEKWGQEAIGLEYEGDLYYVPEKLKKGGSIQNSEPKLNKKESYWEGWGFSDRIKVVLKGDKKNITQGYKDLQVAFPEDQKEIIQGLTIEIFVNEKDLRKVKKIANYNNLALMYEDGGEIDYSTGWNQDYENDPLVKAKRKAKELATRAALAYATAGTSEVARAEGQAIQQGLSTIKPQQTTEQQNTQLNQPQQNNQFQQILNNPELQKMAISALSKGKMARGGEIHYSLGGKSTQSTSEVKKAFELLGDKNKKVSSQFKRGGTTPRQERKIAKVMREFKQGELHSGSKRGPIVRDREQAIAIALSEAKVGKKFRK